MFELHQVFAPMQPTARLSGPVRLIDIVAFKKVVVISVDELSEDGPFRLAYAEWVDLVNSGHLKPVTDPFLNLPSLPGALPPGAMKRHKQVLEVIAMVSASPEMLHSPRGLSAECAKAADAISTSARTVKRWLLAWLRAGRNPAAVIAKFVGKSARLGAAGPARALGGAAEPASLQKRGMKRGARGSRPDAGFDAPAYEVADSIRMAYDTYVCRRKMTWRDAYNEMLIVQYKVPNELVNGANTGFLLTPALIQKYRPPSWFQFRYRCRQFKIADFEQSIGDRLPRGKRGKAHDQAPGPGFFEIDATFMQLQLVSSLTRVDNVSRPAVYLIVDTFSGAIVGYTVTLENPSWAVAALALHNAFTDKGPVFERLGLPYTSKDWPCQHLPSVLRADRAELISNMGQKFPASGIRVEVTPSMTPEAKGTVEGKNAELKKERAGRYNLPGRYSKVLKRRDSDGKRNAALNLIEFERILVEIIMDLNREPVPPQRIPLDALPYGAKVASRIGLYEWGLEHRPGFTRKMPANFVYEHLLTLAEAPVTPLGIKFKGELFMCDHLREARYLQIAVGTDLTVQVTYHPHFAGEIYFFDVRKQSWIRAYNTDPEIGMAKASFAELKDLRAKQRSYRDQASLNSHSVRQDRRPQIQRDITRAAAEASLVRGATKPSAKNIRSNRGLEKAHHRSEGFNGNIEHLPDSSVQSLQNSSRNTPDAAQDVGSAASVSAETPPYKELTKSVEDMMSLWEKLDGPKDS